MKNLNIVRNVIRSALKENIDGANNTLDWELFEMFGWEILRETGYQGDYNSLLLKIRRLIERWGWVFIDTPDN